MRTVIHKLVLEKLDLAGEILVLKVMKECLKMNQVEKTAPQAGINIRYVV